MSILSITHPICEACRVHIPIHEIIMKDTLEYVLPFYYHRKPTRIDGIYGEVSCYGQVTIHI